MAPSCAGATSRSTKPPRMSRYGARWSGRSAQGPRDERRHSRPHRERRCGSHAQSAGAAQCADVFDVRAHPRILREGGAGSVFARDHRDRRGRKGVRGRHGHRRIPRGEDGGGRARLRGEDRARADGLRGAAGSHHRGDFRRVHRRRRGDRGLLRSSDRNGDRRSSAFRSRARSAIACRSQITRGFRLSSVPLA